MWAIVFLPKATLLGSIGSGIPTHLPARVLGRKAGLELSHGPFLLLLCSVVICLLSHLCLQGLETEIMLHPTPVPKT